MATNNSNATSDDFNTSSDKISEAFIDGIYDKLMRAQAILSPSGAERLTQNYQRLQQIAAIVTQLSTMSTRELIKRSGKDSDFLAGLRSWSETANDWLIVSQEITDLVEHTQLRVMAVEAYAEANRT